VSRYLTLALVAPLCACTINGKAVGPRFAGGGASTTPSTDVPAGQPASPRQPDLTVPNLIGMTHAQADEAIRKAGFPERSADLDDMHRTPDDACDDGSTRDRVCQQWPDPGNTQLASHAVQIRIGRYPNAPEVVMPDLDGMTVADALATLRKLGFPPPFVENDGLCDGHAVCGQSIPAGSNAEISWTITIEAHE
jgi:beta-lactam-binding protein with PASTA domain